MRAALNGFWSRVRRVARPGIWVALACLGAGCEAMVSRQYSHDIGDLSRANHIDVTFEYVANPESGKLELPPPRSITDHQRVASVAAFVGRYRDGWHIILGATPGRVLAFYDGDRLLAEIGVFGRGITHESNARPLTSAEVAELVGLLGIPWPSLENPQGPPRRDKAP
jgi:uncharacterized protein YijF (DUF1287 family)